MGDCEETDFFWESATATGKRKRKKETKKKKKGLKHENSITMNKHEVLPKKKRNSKFKETMQGKKDKKKEKKKKTNKLSVGSDNSFVFTLGSSAAHTSKPGASNVSRSTEKLKQDHMIQHSKKKTKREKKVAFDLSPGDARIKRPKLVSSFSQFHTESMQKEPVRNGERDSQVTQTESQDQPQDNESQSTGDNMNSQDLFITQKTFRVSPADPSSGEGSEKDVNTTPQLFKRCYTELQPSLEQIKHHEESANQHPGNTNKKLQQPQTVKLITDEAKEEELHTAYSNPKKWLNTSLTGNNDVPCGFPLRPNVENLCEHMGVKISLDVAESKKRSCACSFPQHRFEQNLLPLMSKESASTQTENFFTTDLSSYLNFCQERRPTVGSEDLMPLDLSMVQRTRNDHGRCVSVNEVENEENHVEKQPSSSLGGVPGDSRVHRSCSTTKRDMKVRKEPCGEPWSVSAKTKGENISSPRSESSEPKSTDMTTSSEDNEPPCPSSKFDLTQVIPCCSNRGVVGRDVWRV